MTRFLKVGYFAFNLNELTLGNGSTQLGRLIRAHIPVPQIERAGACVLFLPLNFGVQFGFFLLHALAYPCGELNRPQGVRLQRLTQGRIKKLSHLRLRV